MLWLAAAVCLHLGPFGVCDVWQQQPYSAPPVYGYQYPPPSWRNDSHRGYWERRHEHERREWRDRD